MAQKRDRIIALILAITFFVTTVGVSALVIWEMVQKDEGPAFTQETGTMLKGTKLSDFTPIEKVDNLQTIDLVEGTGDVVQAGSTITADYTGAYANSGEIFESSLDAGQPLTRPLSGLIAGWQEGVPGMKVGGKRRLIIPADKAYGDADMVFDITVHSVQ